MNISPISIGLLVLVSVLAGCTTSRQQALDLDEQALQLHDAGQYTAALATWDEAIALSADIPELYIHQASTLQTLGNFSGALESLDRAIDLTSDDAALYILRGDIYNQQEQYGEAEQDYTKAVQLVPRSAEATLKKGLIIAAQGNLTGSIPYFDQIIAIHSGASYATALYHKATVLSDLQYQSIGREDMGSGKQYGQQAVAIFDELATISPGFVDAQIYHAITLYDIERYEDARLIMLDALEQDPDNLAAQYHLARIQTALGNTAIAKKLYQQVLDRTPDDIYAQQELARLEQRSTE